MYELFSLLTTRMKSKCLQSIVASIRAALGLPLEWNPGPGRGWILWARPQTDTGVEPHQTLILIWSAESALASNHPTPLRGPGY